MKIAEGEIPGNDASCTEWNIGSSAWSTHWVIANNKVYIDGEYAGDIPVLYPAPSRWTRFRRRLAQWIEG